MAKQPNPEERRKPLQEAHRIAEAKRSAKEQDVGEAGSSIEPVTSSASRAEPSEKDALPRVTLPGTADSTDSNRVALIFLCLGLAGSLLPSGLQLIGITINLSIGSVIMLATFVLLASAFWLASRSAKHRKLIRVSVLALALLCLVLTGRQVLTQYRASRLVTTHSPSAPHIPTAGEVAEEVAKRIPSREPEHPHPRSTPPDKSETQTSGEAPLFREKPDDMVTVSFGGNIAFCKKTELRQHKEFPFRFMGIIPVLYMEKDRLYVDVTASDGSLPVALVHGEFQVKPATWDRNWNDRVFEVVDGNLAPVFQMIYATPQRVMIYGIFPAPIGGFLVVDESGASHHPVVPRDFHLNRIFRYPSWRFPGQYMNQ